MLRLAWPAYTNEAIFLFHATTLVFFSGFPAWQQRGDALYYANYFADKTFNPFIPYPILAGYFIILTLILIGLFGIVNRKLNNHLPKEQHSKIKFKLKLILMKLVNNRNSLITMLKQEQWSFLMKAVYIEDKNHN